MLISVENFTPACNLLRFWCEKPWKNSLFVAKVKNRQDGFPEPCRWQNRRRRGGLLNHLGSYECKLCLTLHNNEGSYLAHTQGKKHQANLARRAAKEAKEAPSSMQPEKPRIEPKKFVKIGRPGYRVTKQREPDNHQQSLLFQIDYPEIQDGIIPRHRFMSAYEQKIEPPDRKWQYLLFAAEPYETIAFKVPSREVEKTEGKFWTHWNKDTKQFFLQFSFKLEPKIIPPPPPNMRMPHPGRPMFNPVPPMGVVPVPPHM
ncbi:hypothetical protein pipiens_007560 [Culex pipiens pipiens]|uniref:Matrin-type domain-containing protein n=1 Tax=Culex pipiens pipiens TaxID=38569 RepID=A0ABD1DL60_CULPP